MGITAVVRAIISRSFLYVGLALLVSFNLEIAGWVQMECDWSIERDHCPVYGTTDWECLRKLKNCTSGVEYHCLRDEFGSWVEVCGKVKSCHKGEEPAYSGTKGIHCQNCSDLERFQPFGKDSNTYSDCVRKKNVCPKEVSVECPNEAERTYQDRKCRCQYEKNFMPQNYDMAKDRWTCAEPDKLNCIQETCPETADGKGQLRGSDYRCSPYTVPTVFTSTEKPTVRSSTDAQNQSHTTFAPKFDGEETGGNRTVLIAVLVIFFGFVGLGLFLLCYACKNLNLKMFKKKKIVCPGMPQGPLEAVSIGFEEVQLTWLPPEHDGGSSITNYILEWNDTKNTDWHKIVIPAEHPNEHEEAVPLLERIEENFTSNITYTVQDLIDGTDYTFQVSAENAKGVGAPLVMENTITTKAYKVPEKPQKFNGYFDKINRYIRLTWEPPIHDGGKPIRDYKIEYRDTNADKWEVVTVEAERREWTKTDLVGGSLYDFIICCQNAKGFGAVELLKAPVKFLTVPKEPLNVQAELIRGESDKVSLSWKPPLTNGGMDIIQYHIRKKQVGSDWESILKVKGSITTQRIIKLVPEMSYYFGVCAENDFGKGDFADTDEPITLPKRIGPPDPVTSLEASDIGCNDLILSWQPSEYDGGFPVTGYLVLKKQDGLFSSWRDGKKVSAAELKHRVRGLTAGTKYYFQVLAQNQRGNSQPQEIEIRTKDATYFKDAKKDSVLTEEDESTSVDKVHNRARLPSKPQNLKLEVKGKKVVASWEPPSLVGGSKIIKYHVDWRLPDSDWENVAVVAASKTKCDLQTVSSGFKFCVRVRAENETGIGNGNETDEIVMLEEKKSFGRRSFRTAPVSNLDTDPQPDRRKVKSLEHVESHESLPVGQLSMPGERETEKSQIVVKPEKPSAPESPLNHSDITHNSVILSWHPPATDRGSSVTHYIIAYKTVKDHSWKQTATEGPVTTFCVSNLQENTEYCFGVAAVNEAGTGSQLDSEQPVKTKKQNKKPSAPEGPLNHSDISHNSVVLAWRPPATDRESSVTHYIIDYKTVKDHSWKQTATEGPETTFCVSDLQENTEYCFGVTAVSEAGAGTRLESKQPVKTKKQSMPPGPPEGLNVKVVKNNTVTLRWRPPKDDGGSKVTSYVLIVRKTDSHEWFLEVELNQENLTYTWRNLPYASLNFSVAAKNVKGKGKTTENEIIIEYPTGPPSSPVGPLQATDVDATELKLSWQSPEFNGGSPVTGYILKGQCENPEWDYLDKIPYDQTNYLVTGLQEQTHYNFSVKAINHWGQSEPLVMTEQIKTNILQVPAQPTGPVEISAVTKNSAHISWKPPSSNTSAITGYIIEYKDTMKTFSDEWTHAGAVTPDQTTWMQTGLAEGHEYIFRIIAINKKGNGQPLNSDRLYIKTVPNKPETIYIMEVTGQNEVDLTWNPPASDGDLPIKQYHVFIKCNDENMKTIAVVNAGLRWFRTKPLSPGHYSFGVCAENDVGCGDPIYTDGSTVIENSEKGKVVEDEMRKIEKAESRSRDHEDYAETLTEETEREKKAKHFLDLLNSTEYWEEFKKTASDLEALLKNLLVIPEEAFSQPSGWTEYTKKIKCDALLPSLKPYKTTSKQSSLFRSISLLLYGNEDYTYRLQLAAVNNGLTNLETYVKDLEEFSKLNKVNLSMFAENVLSEKSLREFVRRKQDDLHSLKGLTMLLIVQDTASPESKNNTLQVQFLSSATGFPIDEYFENDSLDVYENKNKCVYSVKPIVKETIPESKDSLSILWISDPSLPRTRKHRINRVFPLINIQKKA